MPFRTGLNVQYFQTEVSEVKQLSKSALLFRGPTHPQLPLKSIEAYLTMFTLGSQHGFRCLTLGPPHLKIQLLREASLS